MNKIFYVPGDVVQVRHKQLKNRPVMYIVEKVTRSFNRQDGETINSFLGMKCRWFSTTGELCEGIFSSKDLERVK